MGRGGAGERPGFSAQPTAISQSCVFQILSARRSQPGKALASPTLRARVGAEAQVRSPSWCRPLGPTHSPAGLAPWALPPAQVRSQHLRGAAGFRPRGIRPRPSPGDRGPQRGLRALSAPRARPPRALMSLLGQPRASGARVAGVTARPGRVAGVGVGGECVCVWSGQEVSTLRGKERKPRPKERPGPGDGPREGKRARRGLGPLALSAPGRKRRRRLGSPPGSEGEAAAAATAGAPAAGRPWRRQGAQLGLLRALRSPRRAGCFGAGGAEKSCSCVPPSLGVLGSELRLSAGSLLPFLLPLDVSFFNRVPGLFLFGPGRSPERPRRPEARSGTGKRCLRRPGQRQEAGSSYLQGSGRRTVPAPA